MSKQRLSLLSRHRFFVCLTSVVKTFNMISMHFLLHHIDVGRFEVFFVDSRQIRYTSKSREQHETNHIPQPQKWHLNACNMLLMPFYCLFLNLWRITSHAIFFLCSGRSAGGERRFGQLASRSLRRNVSVLRRFINQTRSRKRSKKS